MSCRSKRQMISKIIQYRYDNPHDTLQQIGNAFKVSRQYIHEVLKNNDIPTIRAKRQKGTRYCLVCKELSTTLVHKGTCHFQYYNIKLTCTYCRVPFYRKRADIVHKYHRGYGKNYCSQQCFHKHRSNRFN
jgi:hypothetical protein